MSRWFRFYDDVVNDPKVLSLPEPMRWQWVAVLCIASKHSGELPPIDHVALMLRLTKQRTAAVLTELHVAGLIDKTETGFTPHNWSGRQFHSDTSTPRVKRFRENKRNVSAAVSVTPPDTDSETERKKDAADAAPSDLEKQLFHRGKEVAGKEAGGLIAKLLKVKKGDVALARAAVETASTKQNPREYLGAVISGGHASADGKRLTNDEAYWGPGRTPGII